MYGTLVTNNGRGAFGRGVFGDFFMLNMLTPTISHLLFKMCLFL